MLSGSCHVCGSAFIDGEVFRTHCIEYHEYCVQCDEVFYDKAGFLAHVHLIHRFTSSVNQPNILPGLYGTQLVAVSPAVAGSSTTSTKASTTCKKCRICHIYIEGNELFRSHCIQNHEYCEPCNKPFTSKGGLESHKSTKKHTAQTPTLAPTSISQPSETVYKKCRLCTQSAPFSTRVEYEKHCATKHLYCAKCNGPVSKSCSLKAHNRKAHSSSCIDCGKRYVDKNSLKKHMSKVHKHASALTGTIHGGGTWKCDLCQVSFGSSKELLKHTKTSPRHNWCFVCNRGFTTAAGLQSHLSSQVHRTLDHKCPLCYAEFSLPSAVAHHIESGGCSNITRNQVTAAVQSLDLIPSISLVQRITAPGCSMKAEPIASYVATEMAFDGTGYKCWLCPEKFNKLRDLNQHLNSAAHDKVQFKCPKAKCRKKCTLVSGLIQHIESGACKLATYKEVETYARSWTSQFTGLLLTNLTLGL